MSTHRKESTLVKNGDNTMVDKLKTYPMMINKITPFVHFNHLFELLSLDPTGMEPTNQIQ